MMSAPRKGERPVPAGRRVELDYKRALTIPYRAPLGQVQRMRLAAQCLALDLVFVGDGPLEGELFDGRGQPMGRWRDRTW